VTGTGSVCVFIPAYNAARTLVALVERIPTDLWDACSAVVVLDDGSSDATASVATSLQQRFPKLEVESAPLNQGYGRTVRRGLEIGLARGTDYIACLHADGQYPPEQIMQFVAHMEGEGIDVLQGSRHRDGTAREGGMPLYKIAAGRALTWIENRAFGLSMSDYHSGFLVYRRSAVSQVPIAELSTYFDFDLEFIASACGRNLRIDELGIPTRYADEESHLQPLRYGLRVLRIIGRYLLGRYDPPMKHPTGESR
jgi:glycosyltransferase involved in cell wall biosynthesis